MKKEIHELVNMETTFFTLNQTRLKSKQCLELYKNIDFLGVDLLEKILG